ncbi:MAG: hypothetical protein LUD39_02535 [Opitutae bacterium]|nr:hypothetical protein [Opitutae bacterium]
MKENKIRRGRRIIAAIVAALALTMFVAACSSGPKVINLGNSGSRVTVQSVD